METNERAPERAHINGDNNMDNSRYPLLHCLILLVTSIDRHIILRVSTTETDVCINTREGKILTILFLASCDAFPSWQTIVGLSVWESLNTGECFSEAHSQVYAEKYPTMDTV